MALSPVRTAVVGVGSLGQWHARVFAQACPGAQLMGVYDANPDRAKEIAARYETRVFSSLDEVAASVDAASIAVPTHLHFEVARFLLERGLHLLIEKPLAATAEEALQLCELARHHHRILQVGHIERYNPVFSSLPPSFGPPLAIEAVRLAPYPPPRPGLPPRGTEVSVVHDLMIHDLELALHLARAPLQSIHAWTACYLSPTPDAAFAHLIFENGLKASLWASRTGPDKVRTWRLYYADAIVSLDLQHQTARISRRQNGTLTVSDLLVTPGDALERELADFIAAIRENRPPTVSGKDGLAALRAAEAVLQSTQTENRNAR